MKAFQLTKKSAFILLFLFVCSIAFAQNRSKKAADEWVKSRVWANGLKTNVYPQINSIEFKQQYGANKKLWDEAFAFLADTAKLAALTPGTYPIDGKSVYANVSYAPSKTFEASKWESHQNYIDLQYVISGKEKIGVAPLNSVTVTEPYNAANDVAHYSGDGTYYIATPETFYLFFPNDAHRPNILVEGYSMVKKIVIKIKYTPVN